VQSFAAYWFYLRFGVQPAALGAILWANVFAGISALLATRLAARIGLIRTMVVTHLPSNILLILVPLMPNLSSGGIGASSPFQHQPDGCSHQTVLHHGRRPPEERSAAGGFYRSCPHDRCGPKSTPCGISVRETFVDQHPILQ